MRSESEICVVYITDENYAMPTYISIMSLQENGGNEQYKVYILGDDVSEESCKRLHGLTSENCEIIFITVKNDEYAHLAETCLSAGIHVSKSALFKFELPNILCEDKVLYLDSDVIINKDIGTLYRIDISERYLAAVDDMGDTIQNGQSLHASRIGLSGEHYFNSGVMLLNLSLMREDNISGKLLEYRQNSVNYFMDQDAFNYVCFSKRYILDYTHDFLASAIDFYSLEEVYRNFCKKDYDDYGDCLQDQTIIHVANKLKPWVYNMPWLSEIFFRYYNNSVYKHEKIKLKSMSFYYVDLLHSATDASSYFEKKALWLKEKKQWGFPYEKVSAGSSIVLYGAGEVGRDLYHQIELNNYCSIVLWADKNYHVMQEDVKNPEEIIHLEFDYIIVAILKEGILNEIIDYLKDMGIKEDKIVTM